MKRITPLILFCLWCIPQGLSAIQKPSPLPEIIAKMRIKCEGRAFNINCAKSAGVEFKVYISGGKLHADGAYDGRNLAGRFETVEKHVTVNEESLVSVQFEGTMFLGDDSSGYPSGTEVPYVMNLLFERNSAKGIYRIGRIGDDIVWEQYGTLDLVWDTDGRNQIDPPASGKAG